MGEYIGGTLYKNAGLQEISENLLGQTYSKKAVVNTLAEEGSEIFINNFLTHKAISSSIMSKANHIEIVKDWKTGFNNLSDDVEGKMEEAKQIWSDLNDPWSYLPKDLQKIAPI